MEALRGGGGGELLRGMVLFVIAAQDVRILLVELNNSDTELGVGEPSQSSWIVGR